MADISQVKLPNGDTYNLVDETSGYIKNYTETDPVFAASAAAGITSTDISNWNAKPSTDTNTTYTLSNALASHKFTSTLTAGGSGSGTSTATMEFVAGTGITLTDDTTNKKITIASSVVNTDEKVKSEIVTGSSLYIVGTTSSSTATGTLGKHNSFRAFMSGNTNTDGVTRLYLGNDTAAGTAGAKLGAIQIFSNSAYYVELKAGQNTRPGMTANRTVRLPDADGTIALISNIPQVYSSTNTGGYLTMATLPIYDGTVV